MQSGTLRDLFRSAKKVDTDVFTGGSRANRVDEVDARHPLRQRTAEQWCAPNQRLSIRHDQARLLDMNSAVAHRERIIIRIETLTVLIHPRSTLAR
jgi:hypothetical protein